MQNREQMSYKPVNIILRAVCIIAVAVVLVCVGLYLLSSQRDVRFDAPDTEMGQLPIVGPNALTEMIPGLTMKFDTGCDFSIITRRDLETIKSMGLSVDSTWYPQYGRDRGGHSSIRWRRYKVDVPFGHYEYSMDSIGRVAYKYLGEYNVLRNVDFVLADDSETSLLGIDLLENFILEYEAAMQTLNLCTAIPERYKPVDDIHEVKSLTDLLTLGHRYYVDITLDRKTNLYFLDTGMRDVHIKLPMSAHARSKRNMHSDSILLRGRMIPMFVDSTAWAEYGNRAGSYMAHYYDSWYGDEDYSVNPLMLFQQDAVLDFPNRTLLLRPFVTLPKSPFNRRGD